MGLTWEVLQDNILLSDSGEPMLADFGLSRILGEETMYTSSHHGGGSMPWMSPECMMQGVKSCQSDVYSFGSLVFAVGFPLLNLIPLHWLTDTLLDYDGQVTLHWAGLRSNFGQSLRYKQP